MAGCVITLMLMSATMDGDRMGDEGIRAVERPPTTGRNDPYVGNRPPLLASPLLKLPIGAIEPRGWLRTQLELEAGGFIGHLSEISAFLKRENNAWLSRTGEGDHGWEEVPYWLKGFGDLGYVLGDRRIIDEANIWLEGALGSQREDGYFGPRANLTSLDGKPDLWPHMIMLNALQSKYEFAEDERVLKLMERYFRWELNVPENDFLRPYWQQQRAADNLASAYWLYNRTGQAWLLELGQKIHRRTANWTDGVPNWHGVNIAQAFRGPAVYYQQSLDWSHWLATWQRYQEVMSVYGQVPGGGYGADENCRPGYTGPRQGTETCTWAELMLSFEMLLKITGDTRAADLCEEIAFNSLPASMTADLRGLHYLTAPNLVVCDAKNHAPAIENSGEMLSFNPHGYRCCQHNVSHAWPYYAEHLWAATSDNGMAAVLYAPCQVRAQVGSGREVLISEETAYPFEDNVILRLTVREPVRFPLYLRVPQWCQGPELKVCGRKTEVKTSDLRYVLIDRTWTTGDEVHLRMPMTIQVRRWERNDGSASVHRGPLTYALQIGERWVRYGGTDAWPAQELHPTTPWNYGLVLDDQNPAQWFEVINRPWDKRAQPFAPDTAPVALRARAKKIPNWKIDASGLVGLLRPSPVKSDEPIEQITLIPMGAARLRISAFPVIGSGPDAREWAAP